MYELLDVIIMFQPWLCLDILMAKGKKVWFLVIRSKKKMKPPSQVTSFTILNSNRLLLFYKFHTLISVTAFHCDDVYSFC